MRISDWISDVCSSDLPEIAEHLLGIAVTGNLPERLAAQPVEDAAGQPDRQNAEDGPKQLQGLADQYLRADALPDAEQDVIEKAHGVSFAGSAGLPCLDGLNDGVGEPRQAGQAGGEADQQPRTEERRCGKEGVSTCRY